MRFSLLLLFSCFLFSCEGNKSKPAEGAKPGRYSSGFYASLHTAMDRYYELTDRFVNWDSTAVQGQALRLMQALDAIRLTEVEDSNSAKVTLGRAGHMAMAMQHPGALVEKRHELDQLSQALFAFMKDIRYDATKLYLQKCPMAFNDSEKAVWISDRDTVRNPYLGKYHPYYKSGMLECGSNEAVIDNVSK